MGQQTSAVQPVARLVQAPYWHGEDDATQTFFRAQQPINFTVVGRYVSGYSMWRDVSEETTSYGEVYIEPLRSEDTSCIAALKKMAEDNQHCMYIVL